MEFKYQAIHVKEANSMLLFAITPLLLTMLPIAIYNRQA
jgi:hypothetical protein